MIPTIPLRAGLAATAFLFAAGNLSADDKLPSPYFPDPVGMQLKTESFNTQTLEELHALGFRVVRRGFYWDGIEKEKDKYDFSKWDKEMDRAKELGLTVVGAFFGNNKLHEDDDRGGIQTEAGRNGFAGFAAATAAHYRDHDVLWEIWNEPNVRTFWRKDGMHNSEEFADEYTSLVKAVMPAVLKADPDAFVMAGSVSNYWKPSYEWTEFCFKKGILKTGIRAWSVHPYGVKTPEEFAVGHEITRNLLKQYGAPDLPMLNTERGFSIGKTTGGSRPDEGWSGGEASGALGYQAWNLIRQYMIDQLHDVHLTIWYEWGGKEFGISDKSSPAHIAAKVMIDQLTGYKLVNRLKSDSELDYVLLFESKEGERKLVAWTAPPAGGTPDEAKAHKAKIAVRGGGSIEAFKSVAIDGSPRQTEVQDGAVVLDLSAAAQYVVVPKGVEPGEVTSLAKHEPATPDAAPEGTDLALFGEDHGWEFIKNTGEGSFSVKEEDGTRIGVVEYDFSSASAQGTPYVLAMSPVDIPGNPTSLTMRARASVRQPLTFRLVDTTGQTLQFKTTLKGTGEWELITIPLDRKLEHWDGANDGKVHFPITRLGFSVPQPAEDAKKGTVEYANVTVN